MQESLSAGYGPKWCEAMRAVAPIQGEGFDDWLDRCAWAFIQGSSPVIEIPTAMVPRWLENQENGEPYFTALLTDLRAPKAVILRHVEAILDELQSADCRAVHSRSLSMRPWVHATLAFNAPVDTSALTKTLNVYLVSKENPKLSNLEVYARAGLRVGAKSASSHRAEQVEVSQRRRRAKALLEHGIPMGSFPDPDLPPVGNHHVLTRFERESLVSVRTVERESEWSDPMSAEELIRWLDALQHQHEPDEPARAASARRGRRG